MAGHKPDPTPDMSLADAVTHARAYVARVVRPFEQVEAVLKTALAAESQLAGLERRRADLQGLLADLEHQTAAATRDLQAYEAECAAKRRELDRGIATLVAAQDMRRQAHETQLAELTAVYQQREAALQAGLETRRATLQTEIDALEARKAQYNAWKASLA
jgi:chromosome segregation ATPase